MKAIYIDIGQELQLGVPSRVEVIQSLWGGYGQLVRLWFAHESIIVKHVKLEKPPSHPKGHNSTLSHTRKLHSYSVEVNWYKHFSKPVDEKCYIPIGLKSVQAPNEWLIVMQDLARAGFEYTTTTPTSAHLKASLTWLAHFHAKYMGFRSDLVWDIGTYWHLNTRPHELEALQDSTLKSAAHAIDEVLNSTRYQTLVHGDAKLANFCFNKHGTQCAAVDFQYVGHGCGIKDVVYFMSSSINPDAYFEMQEWVLDTYFEALREALKHYDSALDSTSIEQEWRSLFSVAWADFVRFMKGWSPEHFKINAYSKSQTQLALKQLNVT